MCEQYIQYGNIFNLNGAVVKADDVRGLTVVAQVADDVQLLLRHLHHRIGNQPQRDLQAGRRSQRARVGVVVRSSVLWHHLSEVQRRLQLEKGAHAVDKLLEHGLIDNLLQRSVCLAQLEEDSQHGQPILVVLCVRERAVLFIPVHDVEFHRERMPVEQVFGALALLTTPVDVPLVGHIIVLAQQRAGENRLVVCNKMEKQPTSRAQHKFQPKTMPQK